MHKNNIHVVSRAVLIDQEHILLCKTTDLENNYYFLPGGHIEYMESAENVLIRELMEETGYECEIKRFLGCFEHSFEPSHNNICHNHEYNFIFEVKSASLHLNSSIIKLEENIELQWHHLNDIYNIDFRRKSLLPIILQWQKDKTNNLLQSVMI